MQKRRLRTVLGDIPPEDLGLILPHEHLFTDLRGPEVEDYAQADPKQVLSVMQPFLKQAHDAGVSALVECSTIGVGRNIEILRTLAEASRVHILAPTGLYREEYVPAIYHNQSIAEIAELFILELTQGIGMSRSKAGFIKIAMSNDGPRPIEVRNLKAAALASQSTGAAIASHTIGGRAASKEIEILAEEGLALDRFIWVHAGSESDQGFHLWAAEQGAFVEFDSIGNPETDEKTAQDVVNLLENGYGDRILLSHDAGWFQPGRPGGKPEHGFRGFTSLSENFIPRLQHQGVDSESIRTMTKENPVRAFGIPM